MELRRNGNHNLKPSNPARLAPQDSGAARVRRGGLEITLIVLLIVASIALIAYLGSRFAFSLTANSQVKSKQYQAVFLANGQVYFGKLRHANNNYVELSDIYYLQVQQQVQPGTNANANQQNEQPQVSLAKLGSELHGPEDAMYISRDQVLFWENLKDDGKVVKAIQEDK